MSVAVVNMIPGGHVGLKAGDIPKNQIAKSLNAIV